METTITRNELYGLLDSEFGWAVYRPIRPGDIWLWLDYYYGLMAPSIVD